ncbi:AI-2E family transporter [Aurantimonas sp. Leaf443]|uniref:AI-2E family transporter n=1 Tax=Aurantimonas sp. Leaf443 TaxID=1736378 RepID=UPI000700E64E|nr:AI-2E family transporter [Aurantimonas sp. Leaf443]KQT85529.1 hypothetical protein ASG48_09975 [Aurantimonas sp. Leaf443]
MDRIDGDAAFARRVVIALGIALAMGLVAYGVLLASSAFFLIFGGMVLASVFTGIANGFGRLGLPHTAGLVLTVLLVFGLLAGGLAWGGLALVDQFSDLLDLVDGQLSSLPQRLESIGLPGIGGFDPDQLKTFLPNPSGLFSSASQTAFSVLGGLGNFLILLFLAIFISWQPGLYRRGIVSLFPKHRRPRIEEAVVLSAHELVLWLAGQAISMVTIFAVTLLGLWLIGMPSTFLLALQAGLLAFVPTLGPFVAGVVIVLAGFADSPQMALYGLLVYVVIQGIESNVAQPIAQRYTSALPPALTLGAQLVFGVLFGLIGVALVVPLVAVVKRLVQELYIEDTLGGPLSERADERLYARAEDKL